MLIGFRISVLVKIEVAQDGFCKLGKWEHTSEMVSSMITNLNYVQKICIHKVVYAYIMDCHYDLQLHHSSPAVIKICPIPTSLKTDNAFV